MSTNLQPLYEYLHKTVENLIMNIEFSDKCDYDVDDLKYIIDDITLDLYLTHENIRPASRTIGTFLDNITINKMYKTDVYKNFIYDIRSTNVLDISYDKYTDSSVKPYCIIIFNKNNPDIYVKLENLKNLAEKLFDYIVGVFDDIDHSDEYHEEMGKILGYPFAGPPLKIKLNKKFYDILIKMRSDTDEYYYFNCLCPDYAIDEALGKAYKIKENMDIAFSKLTIGLYVDIETTRLKSRNFK